MVNLLLFLFGYVADLARPIYPNARRNSRLNVVFDCGPRINALNFLRAAMIQHK